MEDLIRRFHAKNNHGEPYIDYEEVDGIVIPSGATNGDVCKLVFGENSVVTFDRYNYWKDWWNSPYRADKEEKMLEVGTTVRKTGEFVKKDGEFRVKYITFCCNNCGRLMRYRWSENGEYAHYCDWCGKPIDNMPFSKYEICNHMEG